MKHHLVAFIVIGVSVCFQSCKKCAVCRNECFKCGTLNPSIICSTDYSGQANWQTSRDFLISNGCQPTEPTQTPKVCDNNLDNVTYLYEQNNYYCD
jgi:hypothetical protein